MSWLILAIYVVIVFAAVWWATGVVLRWAERALGGHPPVGDERDVDPRK